VFAWLEEDRKRRTADTKENGGAGLALATAALEQARQEMDAKKLFRAAAKLEWVSDRFTGTTTARQAKELLDEWNTDNDKKRRLPTLRDEERIVVLAARARALERFGRLGEARRAWLDAAEIGPAPKRNSRYRGEATGGRAGKSAVSGPDVRGRDDVGEGHEPGGPARRGGLRPNDRVEKVGPAEVDSPARCGN